jgi:beta-phosphoglucomutase
LKAVIFDLDGVIVDTAKYHYLAWKRLAAGLGIDLTEEMNERLKGVSRVESLDMILIVKKIQISATEKESMANIKNNWFLEYIHAMKPDEIFPGVRELMTQIRKNGKKIALASSSKNALKVLELLGIRHEFDTVVDGNMITHTKPHPEIFLKAAANLKLAPAECVVIEDAEAGVEAAVRAGMKCVGIGSAKQLSKASLVLNRIGSLKYNQLIELMPPN